MARISVRASPLPYSHDELIALLVRHALARGEALRDHEVALRAMQRGQPEPTLGEVLGALDGANEPELAELASRLEEELLDLARQAHALGEGGLAWTPRMRAEFEGLDDRDGERARAVQVALRYGTPGVFPGEVLHNRLEEERAEQEDLAPESATPIDASEVGGAPDAGIAPAETEAVPEPETPAPVPAEPPAPTVWNQHLRPFLLDNWYIAVGALMVVVGSSLVAYFTWERHWAVRYTVLPVLLAAFTGTLGWLGRWLEGKDPKLTGSGAVLRGAAIALLPINFMTVARMSSDPEIWRPRLLVPLAAALYLVVFGRWLLRWCGEVHAALRGVLGPPLLSLCALVFTAPLATAVGVAPDGAAMGSIIAVGFYAGFAVAGAAVLRFTAQILDEGTAGANRVPWFFGATLGVTFVQAFAWSYLTVGQLPAASTYAPLAILAGGLVLLIERRVLTLVDREDRVATESFLGYAAILLGLLMATPSAPMRVAAFALAGAVWLAQATPPRDVLHAWISLTLMALSGASITLLHGFPGAWRGWFGLGLGLAFGAASWACRRAGRAVVAETARQLQVVIVVLSAAVGMLAQWHFGALDPPPPGAQPLWTAGLLIAASAVLMVRAHRSRRSAWVLTGAVLLALSLPYLGCVDLEGRTWHGNTMVFGLGVLSLLWVALDLIRPTAMTREARSSVLWFYGALGVAAMTLRVFLEHDSPHRLLDHSGPFLIAGSLAIGTYWSRSLVPAGMAAVIVVILFPELQSRYAAQLEALGWGTGLAGALSSLGLIAFCGWLRRRPWLADLGPGDRFLGAAEFPLRRHDWTLFTIPLLASAVYTLVRTSTVVLWNHLGLEVQWEAALAQVLCGVGWVAFAAYGHRRPVAPLGVYVGFLQVLVGLVLWHGPAELSSLPFLVFGLTLQAVAWVFGRFGPRWSRDLIGEAAAGVVRRGALLAAPLCILALQGASPSLETHLFTGFVALTLLAAGIARGHRVYGLTLFPLLVAAGVFHTRALQGDGVANGVLHHAVVACSLALLTCIVSASLRGRRARRLMRPVLKPLHAWSFMVSVLGAAVAWLFVIDGNDVPRGELVVVTLAVLAVARAHRSGLMFLVGASVVHLIVTVPAAGLLGLVEPWRLGALAMGIAASAELGRRAPRVIARGHAPGPFDPVQPRTWIAVGVGGLGALAVLLQLGVSGWRGDRGQLAAGYLAGAAGLITARRLDDGSGRGRSWFVIFGSLAIALLTASNIEVVRVVGDAHWTRWGIHEIQQVAGGLLLTLLAAQIARLWRQGAVLIDRASALVAGLVLALLGAHYVGSPDLSLMRWPRLVVSAALAFGAAQTFRTLARRPLAPPAVSVRTAESAYHLGLTVSLWGAFLLVPQLRSASMALVALSVPFFWFLLRAELLRGHDGRAERSYVASAAILGHVLLGLYAARGLFQVILFPGEAVPLGHYHVNSWAPILVGLGLVRLHAHRRLAICALTGGVALIAGSYFAVTSFAAIDPFEAPVAGAWVLVAVAHFWTVTSRQRSPLRTGIQQLGGIDDDVWHGLRRAWGVVLMLAAQVAPWLAVAEGEWKAVAPLAAGAASVIVHHGWIRRSGLYFAAAAVELGLALHLDFLAPSHLDRDHVVWALLATWALLTALDLVRRLPAGVWPPIGSAMALLVLAQVVFHGPASGVGWVAFAAGCALLLAGPRRTAQWTDDRLDAWTPLLFLAPAWLAYFGAVEDGVALEAWPLLLGASALALTGAGACWSLARERAGAAPARPRLGHRLVDLASRHGANIGRGALYVALTAALGVLGLEWGEPFEARELTALCLLLAGCAFGLHLDGRARRAMVPYGLLHVALLGILVAVRQQLALTTDWWMVEYDVWAACAATLLLAGAKQVWDLRPREVRVPMEIGLFLMPVAALWWSVVHEELGVDEQLLILGIHSLTYSFLGRDDRESPYHLVGVAGFVAFILLTFWSRLELRSVQAYVVPVAAGVLVLAQLFKGRMTPVILGQVRGLAGVAMVGSAGYEALADGRYPVLFHASLLILGLVTMGLGGFLRVRVYLWVGTGGVLVALASITYRALAGIDRTARMSAIGVLVLLIGAGLVGGAIYVKTHRERVADAVERWRKRLGEWD